MFPAAWPGEAYPGAEHEPQPSYEGVTLVELGFDIDRHPAIDALTGRGKMFAVGDTFETETPSPAILRQALGQALAAMAGHRDLRWFISPRQP